MAAYSDSDLDRETMIRMLQQGQTPKATLPGNPYEQGGVTGGGVSVDPAPVETAAAPAAFKSSLGGYDPAKLTAEHAAKSPKYAFGMLAREFEDTPEGLLAMSQDPRFAQGGFKLDNLKSGKILAPDPDRGGALGLVDVGNSFGAGGHKGWQWGAEGPGVAPGPSGGGAMAALGPSSFQGIQSLAPTDTGFYQKLQDQIAQILGGPGALDRNALLQMLGA